MNNVDASDHYEVSSHETTPSLLSIVIDTNPRAWATLNDVLPLSKAIASILVFVNAHLAFSNANQVAIIASHSNRAVWLYPTKPEPKAASTNGASEDVDMADAFAPTPNKSNANKYPQFAQIEKAVLGAIREVINQTTEVDLSCTTTQLSGALTLALSYINKASMALNETNKTPEATRATSSALTRLHARIFILSVSDSEPVQYIPTMNAVFAAAHSQIPIDTLALSGDATFLQQASYITDGTFMQAASPRGLLSYLMFAYSADAEARSSLIPPTHHTVDFRAACFCHGRVVDTGFVCSICLSIFCDVPENSECLTCGTKLSLGSYGAKPAVVPRRKKKKKKVLANGNIREETGTPGGTPRPA
ncbi:RNA polymerase II transcription factor B subunit 4 [Colletotrichum gloeosporioides]|uniref:General transcription and DNA repair factor IIH subunit TFB4 n=1 Tax=Colletotrichum gloeosporioides TaxID=474922 RepID=A0A8H4C959_COLGL|nr:RNA polymerase II transcription factor B subunit 4 [Colletotrichum gloeosporioides]KAF3799471.1 RNA polymerase II transcription factor B subunit 4 [Colletotrichum gloeosporioides]